MNFHENIRLPAERSQLASLRRYIEAQAGRTPATEEETQDLVQAVDEAATNIIVHGYADSGGAIWVAVDYQPGKITITLRDQAPPFDPTTVPEPDINRPIEERPVGGLGVHFIRVCVDEFTHSTLPGGGNELRLVKCLQNNGG